MASTWVFFKAILTLLDIAHIEKVNNVDDDFTEDVRTFLISDFQSTLNKYFFGGVKNTDW